MTPIRCATRTSCPHVVLEGKANTRVGFRRSDKQLWRFHSCEV